MPPARLLHVTVEGRGLPVVLLHGFTQSGRSWGPVGERLAAHHTVVHIDAPGHGGSADVAADLGEGADLMASAVAASGIGSAAWVGYSMGGRFALHVALRHPTAVRRLVVVSAHPGIEDATERQARRSADEALARRVESEGVEEFVRWWLSQPLFATLAPGAAQMESRLGGSAAGLASSLRRAGTGAQRPLWDRLGRLDMPVLVLAGELDTRYAALGRRTALAIGANAHFELVPGAGHTCHLEQPGRFLDLVTPFIDGR